MNLLFVGPTYIGDAAIATGMLDHLLRVHPGARVTVACGAPAAPLFRAVPNLAGLVPIVKRGVIGHWLGLWRAVAGTSWDLVVDLRGSGLAWLLRARKRRIFRPDKRHAHRTQALAATLGLGELPPPVAWTTAEDETEAARLLPPGPPLLALGPTGNWPPKLWAPSRFAALARRLTDARGPLAGGRIAVLAAAHEAAMVAPLLAELPPERTLPLVGRLNLTGVSALLRRAALFVGNDSGPLYLAVASGAPALGLFGPTPGLFGPPCGDAPAPWAPKATALRSARSAALVHDTPIEGGRELMDEVTVEMAEAASRALLDRIAARRATGG